MSKTFKTDPVDVQVRRQMKTDPYRFTQKNESNSRMLKKDKYQIQHTVIFRANEAKEMEAFLSMLDANKETITHQYGRKMKKTLTYTTKDVDGYLEAGSPVSVSYYDIYTGRAQEIDETGKGANGYRRTVRLRTAFDNLTGYDQDMFDAIVARVAVHEKSSAKTHGEKFDLFTVVTVTRETVSHDPYEDEQYEYTYGYEYGKMFSRYNNDFYTDYRVISKSRVDNADMQDALGSWQDEMIEAEDDTETKVLDDEHVLVYTSESE